MGTVAILGGGDATVYSGQPHFVVTERGRRMLERKDASPHNADRYLDAVRRRVAAPDPIAMAYLEEAAGAWRAGLNRSSIVTLGCACERLILILAEAVRDAGIVPWDTKLTKMLTASKPVGISDVFDQVRDALSQGASLPRDLSDTLERTLTPTFVRARGLRNQHGHPTRVDVSAEDAEAGLLLFPGFYAVVDRIQQHLKGA
jgi:hypothetical protein